MQFLFPGFLFALSALAIPIVIHLFYFRRFKKVYFTNVRFLREVKDETSSRRKLRNLLVLIARCLAVAMLVLAFAQPFIPQDTEVKKGENAVSVFVDNSFSMSALSEDASLLEKAKQRAKEIINAYAVDDRFQVLTNDFDGKHQRLVSKDEAIGLVEEIKASPAVRTLSQILNRQSQALGSGKSDNKISYVVSDFQKNMVDFSKYKDTLLDVNLVPLLAVQENNVSIDSAWFDTPVQILGQPNPLIVKVKNWSAEPAENVRLTVKYDGETKPVGELSVPGNSSMLDTVLISIQKPGWHEAELSLTDFPVQFDDHFFFTYDVANEINVLVINENLPSQYLESAFKGVGYFKVDNQSSSQITYSSFPNYQLIVLNGLSNVSSGLAQELKQYISNGGNALVFPAANANTGSYNQFLSSVPANELQTFEQVERTVADVNTEEFVFKDVFENKSANLKLPITKGNFVLTRMASRAEEKLLTYRDGSSFLGKYKTGEGILYLCSAPLSIEMSNLANNGEIFIPMLFKMALSSARKRPIAYTLGKDESVESDNLVKGGESVYKLSGKDAEGSVAEEFIPQQRIVGSKVFIGLQNQISEAGYYDLFLNPDSTLAKFAFNYDRSESALQYYQDEELAEMAPKNITVLTGSASANFESVVADRSKGVVLWKWCVIIALIALALEVALLRFWKV